MRLRSSSIAVLAHVLLGLTSDPAAALIFFDTDDPAHNREIAPTGSLAGAGWQYQGDYRIFLGTMISPRHFLTARHVGTSGTTFTHRAHFSGDGVDRVYLINPNFNAGVGYADIPDTDLRVFEIYGEFPYYAPLYTKSNEVGKETVMFGRGRQRGDAVTIGGELRGWQWGDGDRRTRWGTNDVDSIENGSLGDFLVTDFDEAAGTDECHAASGDSGGGLFIKDGSTWKLAGIFYAVDGKYDMNATCGDDSEFNAAMFDADGLYVGNDNADCDGWEAVSASEDTDESRAYASRISASAAAIQSIIQPAIDDAAKTPRERYDDWYSSFGLGTSNAAPEDDPEGDSQPNALEYLANLDPGRIDAPEAAFLVEESPGGKIRFTLRVRLDAEARGLSWEIQETGNLAQDGYSLVDGLFLVNSVSSRTQGVETIEYEIDRPAAAQMFYRLAVSIDS